MVRPTYDRLRHLSERCIVASMARKSEIDFNTRVHDIFERISRGEPSPHRLSRQELVKALETAERNRKVSSEREPDDQTDKD